MEKTLLQIFKQVINLRDADQGEQLGEVDLQVGRQVHYRQPGNMRTELWKSLLAKGRVGDGYSALYPHMLAKVRPSGCFVG